MAAKLATTFTTLKHETRAQSLGGHVRSPQSHDSWIKAQVDDWAHGVTALGKMVMCFPQTAYAGIVKSLQNEWKYLQRVTLGNGKLYEPIEKAIMDDLLRNFWTSPA